MKRFIVVLSVLVVLSGCNLTHKTPAGDTVLKPETIAQIDSAISITEELGQATTALGMLIPTLIPIGTLLLGAAGVARKMKPKLAAANTNAAIAGAAIHDIVAAIEDYKDRNGVEWLKLKNILEKKTTPITKRIVNENK